DPRDRCISKARRFGPLAAGPATATRFGRQGMTVGITMNGILTIDESGVNDDASDDDIVAKNPGDIQVATTFGLTGNTGLYQTDLGYQPTGSLSTSTNGDGAVYAELGSPSISAVTFSN